MPTNRDSIVTDDTRKRMLAYAETIMFWPLRQRHDPEDAVQSAEASANQSKNAHIWDLPPEELLHRLLVKTRYHVWNRVAHETADKRSPAHESGPVEQHGDFAGDGPNPGDVAAWKDFWNWLRQELEASHPGYGRILELLLDGKSNAEIADQLGVGIKTVQRKVREAVDIARKKLAADE